MLKKTRTRKSVRRRHAKSPSLSTERLETRLLLFGTPLGQFVDAAYQDVLERPAEGSGLEYWTNRLGANAITRGDVAQSILVSGEHARATVNDLYTSILGRAADPAGLSYWAGAIQAGTSELDVEAGFLGSGEYFQKEGGTNASFIAAAYQDILGRTAGPSETAFWLDRLNVISREQVARNIIYSPENLRQEVSDWYETYLHRTPDGGGLAYWTGLLSAGTNPNTIQTGFIASQEYFDRETAPAIRVPGATGTIQTTIHWGGRTDFTSEVGLFVVDNDLGLLNGMDPSNPDYAQAALSSPSRQVIFTKEQAPTNTSVDPATLPGSTTLNLPAGALMGIYVVQDGAAADALPPTPRAERPNVYFSFPSGNGDGFDHYRYGNYVLVGLEDLPNGGDKDFDDAVLRFEFPEDTGTPPANRPPVIASIANQTIPEEAAFQLSVSATDPDGPASAIRFSLDAASVNRGLAIDPVTGLLTWTPTEAQGPGAYSVIVKATDGGSPAAASERTFTINVTEVNRPPVLADIPSRTVSSGTNVVFTATATDPDLPANALLFSLIGAPAGATLDAATGAFQWTPTSDQAGESYTMTVRVSDQQNPALTDEATFSITVEDCVFDREPDAWTSFEDGGSVTGQGTTSVAEQLATLIEGDSFTVGIERTIAIPGTPSQLRFTILSANFDTTSSGEIRDAFEAALVDESGTPVVLPFAAGRDAFFNLTEGIPAAFGPGVTFDGNTVIVDLSDVTVTSARLIFRLVNNDEDVASTVSLTCVRVEPLTTPLRSRPLAAPQPSAGSYNPNSTADSATRSSTMLVGPALPPGVLPRSAATNPPPSTPPVATPQDDPLPVDTFTIDNRGKDFWLGFADNLLEGGNQATKTLFITGDVATTGTVSVPGLSFEQAFAVNPGEVTAVVLPTLVEVESLFDIQDLGVHVVANEEVTVYGLNRAQSTTDAFLALPTDSLGTEYLNLTYRNGGYFLAFVAGTQLLLVGAEDDTQVTISPGVYSIPTANSNVSWLGPANNTIFSIPNGTDSNLFVVDTAGNYQLNVAPPTLGYAGTYRFRILDLATNSTAINIGQTVAGDLPNGQDTVVYRFAGTTGQRVFIDGQNPSFVFNSSYRVLSPSGVFLAQANLENNTELLTLTETGDYYILVSTAANTPVSYQFRVLDFADATPIALNTVIADSTPAGVRRTDMYQFAGTLGQELAFDGQSVARGSDVAVFTPAGAVLTSFNSGDDRYPITLPATGTYTITVDGRSPGEDYSFRVLDLADVPVAVYGTAVNAASTNNRELTVYAFEGVAGERIQYDALTATALDFQVYGPLGITTFVGRTNTDSDVWTLPYTGTYYFYALGAAAGPQTLPFRLLNLANAPEYTLGATLTGNLGSFESQAYRFDLAAGMPLFYDGLDGDFDPVRIRVVGPNGALIGPFFNADADSNIALSLADGDGFLFVSNEQAPAADYGLVLSDVSTAPVLPLGTDVTANLPTGREAVVYRVDAAVGDRLIYDGRVGSGSSPARLLRPNGQALFQANTNADSPVTTIVDEGSHYLIVLGGESGAATAQFRVHDADAAPALPFDADTAVSITPGNALAVYAFNATAGQRASFDNLSVATPGAGSWMLVAPNNATVVVRNIEIDFAADLTQTGQYLLVFAGNGAQASVQATFRATLTTPAPVAPTGFGTIQTLAITAGQTATYQFTAPAGRVAYLDSLNTAFQNLRVELRDPNGVAMLSTNDLTDQGPVTLPAAGTYSVVIAGNTPSQAGSYRFRVLDLSTAPALAFNTLVEGTSLPFEAAVYQFTSAVGDEYVYNGVDADFDDVQAIVALQSGVRAGQVNSDSEMRIGPINESGTSYVVLQNNLNASPNYRFRLLATAQAPTLALGDLITGAFTVGTETIQYQFTGTAGQRVLYDGLEADFDNVSAQLLAPGNAQLFSLNADLQSDPLVLPRTGTYTLVLQGNSVAGADYRFRMLDVSAPAEFQVGDTVTGNVGASGREVTAFSFQGSAGQQLFYDALDGDFDAVFVSIRDPFNNELRFSNADVDSAVLPLTVDGLYSVYVYGGTPNADFSFVLRDLADAVPLTVDAEVTGQTQSGRDTVAYTFDAVAGQTFYYNGLDNDNDNTQVLVQNEKFQNVLVKNSASEDGLFTATSTGKYHLFLVGRTGAPEDYRFQLLNVGGAPTIDYGDDVAGTLPLGTEHVVYRFDGAAGQRIYYDGLDNDNDQVLARIVSPSGVTFRFLNSDDNSGVFSLGETGPHYVIIEGNAAPGANFRFQLLDVEAAPILNYGVDIAATLDPGRETQLFRVPGVPGNSILFDSSSPAGGAANWFLTDPANRQVVGTDQASDFTSTLLYAGDYVLIVSGNVAAPVNYSFRATSTTLPTAPLSGFGVDQTAVLGINETATFNFSAPIGTLAYLDVLQSTFAVPEHTITLNAGETYLLRDALGANDLTGTVVTANKPLAAFGSNLCAFVPDFTGFCDNLVEQLPPTDAWGREFVTVPLATRLNGDTFRFLAQDDGTEVRINGTLVATLDRGEFYEQNLKTASEVSATHPILVGQYSNGSTFDGVTSDPFMVYLPPYEQFLSNYTVTTPATGFPINYVNVVASAADVGAIELDGAAIPANLFTAIGTSGFFGAQVAVELGAHTFAGPSPFGLTVYGYSTFDSYGYVGGQSLAPVAAAASLNLTVQQATVPIGAEAVVLATVLDDFDQPLAGVRVDFAIAGANPQTAFAFTDNNGVATLRYVGTVSGLDTIDAAVSHLTDTATITWGAPVGGPSISILTPEDGTDIAAGTTVAVAGLAEADRPFASVILVTVNGQPVEALDAAGNFFVRLAVLPGDNVYEFEVTDSRDQTARTTLVLQGVQRAAGDVEFDLLSNVSASFAPQYARTSLKDDDDTLFAEIAIRNEGQYPADAPLFVAITNLSDPTVRVLDADGYTPEGAPYYDFTGLVTGGTLAPRSATGFLSATFLTPGRTQFTYDLEFFGKLNAAPAFVTTPVVDGLAGRSYRYDALATDEDGDAVTFSLPIAPEGMTIDSATGRIDWLPGTDDLGVQEVIVLADDGRGGTTEQRFLITVVTPPPNRPPVFSTLPVVSAEAEAAYRYDADASDADGDALVFALTAAPAGMTINDATGLVSWTPAPAQTGDFEVVVQVEDGTGGVATQRFVVCVEPSSANYAPVITSAAELFATGDYEYQVRALDANGDALVFTLDQFPAGMAINASTGLITWSTTAADEGTHDVVVRVSDSRGGIDTHSFTLTVIDNAAPTFTSAPVTVATVGVLYVYDADATDADALTYSLLRAPSGMTIDAATGLIQWTPAATHYAQERVVVEANDGQGGRARQSFIIQVANGLSLAANVAPQFVTAAPLTGAAHQLYRYDAVAVDPNDDPVVYDLPLAPAGMAIDAATGTVAWTPRAEQTGPQQVVLRARDNQGGVSQQSFTIQIAAANHAPVFSTEPGEQAVVGSPFAYMVAAQDADGDELEFTLQDAPAGATLGEVFGLPNRAILVWTPSAAGPESFTIQTSDGKGGITTQQFVVTAVTSAVNHDPVIASTPRGSIPLGRTWFYLPEASDEDSDRLTFTLLEGPAGMSSDPVSGQLIWTPTDAQLGASTVTLRLEDGRGGEFTQSFAIEVTSTEANGAPTIVSVPLTSAVVADSEFQYQSRAIDPDHDPVEWSLVEAPAGVSIDPLSGQVRWTPGLDQLGVHEIVIQARDPFLASTTQRVSLVVTCVNQLPSILSRPVTSANADARYIYGLRAVDPENAALAYSLVDAPDGMTIDGATGVLRWTPTVAQLGSANVRVRVTDASGASAEQAFTIDVTQVIPDLAPIFRSRAPFRATVGALYEYQAEAVDPEGAAVTYALLEAPAGMTIDPATGLITWTPAAAQAGAHVVIVAADDATGNRGQQRYALLARVNQAPEIISDAPVTISAGAVYQYDVQVDDPENDPITYTLLQAPAGMTIDALGRIAWTTAVADLGAYPITVQAADVHGLVDTQSFTLTVAPDAIAPRVSVALSTPRVAIGSPVVISVQAMDDVGIASLTLTVNGQPVTLNEQGTAIYTPAAPGQLNVVATATDAAGNVGQANALLRAFDPADTDGPLVEIISPSDGTVVTQLTDILGTASDANPLSYRLEYARADLVDVNDPTADDSDWQLIVASTNSVVNDALGAFDPTLLLNDNYVIRVIAEDTSGNLSARTVALSLDGNLKLGPLSTAVTDLAIPLAGIPITVVRTYDTREATVEGDFGFGWKLAVQDATIRESVPVSDFEQQGVPFAVNPFRIGTRVYLTNPSGRRVGFTFTPTPSFSLFGGGFWIPKFTPDPGVYDTLEVDESSLQLRFDGTFGLHLLGFPYNPSVYRLTTREGLTYQYDQFQGLQSISDRNGNSVTFQENGIVGSNGESVDFERDSFGRITRVIDPDGQAIQYAYDAAGNLQTVTDRAGLTTTYDYFADPAHYLRSVVDSLGQELLRNEYDAQGRLTGVTSASGGLSQIDYDPETRTETVTDGLGNVTVTAFDDRGNPLSVTDALGKVREMSYDGAGNVLTVTDPLGRTITRTVDANGNLTSIADPLGNTTTVAYRDDNQISSVTDALGRTATFFYDAQGNLVQMVNALGETSGYVRDGRGRVIEQFDALGRITAYDYANDSARPTTTTYADGTTLVQEYDSDGRILRAVDANGNETNYTYDANGRPLSKTDSLGNAALFRYEGSNLTEIEDARGNITRYEYDEAGRRIRMIDPLGEITAYAYNVNDQLVEETDPRGAVTRYAYRADNQVDFVTDALGNVTRFEYDDTGNRIAVIDARLNRTEYEYDELGRLVKRINPDGGEETYQYDASGKYTATTDANGGTTRYEYDALNRIAAMIDPRGGRSTFQYDAVGNIAFITDAEGRVTAFEYDDRDRVERFVLPTGAFSSYAYDDVGNLLTMTDELGKVTQYGYDAVNRRTSTTDPGGGVYQYEFDEVGNTVRIVDPAGRATKFAFDGTNTVTSTEDALGQTTRFEYDAAGNRSAVVDPAGQRTEFEYDLMGNLVQRTDPLGNAATFEYDDVYNLVRTVDRNGRVRRYEYDDMNRFTDEFWEDAGGNDIRHLQYSYDAVGNQIGASDPSAGYQFDYDAFNLLIGAQSTLAGGLIDLDFTSAYDGVGNRLSISDSLGVGVTATFNARDQVSTLTWQGAGVDAARVEYSYNARGEVTDVERFADATGTNRIGRSTFEYNDIGMLTDLAHLGALDQALADYDYEFDLAAQLLSESHHGQSTEYDYDELGQLISADHSSLDDELFSYDANGNRDGDEDVIGPNNQLLADATFDYQYDDEGNLVERRNRTTNESNQYSYDHRNRLVRVDEFDGAGALAQRSEYEYDVYDRRVARTVDGDTTYTVYDGANAWADFDASGAVTARYLFGEQVDEPIARYRAGEGTTWYLADRLGSVRELANAAGDVVDSVVYDSFGNVVTETNPAFGDRFKFTAREYDGETGLYYYRARYYDPATGRFLSQDPLGFRAGDTNLQRYVGNSPTNFTDPSGLQAGSEWVSILALQKTILDTALNYGGDEPFTFAVRGSARGISGGFDANPSFSGNVPIGGSDIGATWNMQGGGSVTIPIPEGGGSVKFTHYATGGNNVTFTPPKKLPDLPPPFNYAGYAAKPISFGKPNTPPPPHESEFNFLVSATAKERNLIASFNVAVFAGVATELSLIAKYAVTDDMSTLVTVNFKDEADGSWVSHGFATREPTPPPYGTSGGSGGMGDGSSPPPPTPPGGGGGSPNPGGGPGPGGGPNDGGGGAGGGGGCTSLFGVRSYLRSPGIQTVWNDYNPFLCCVMLVNRNYGTCRDKVGYGLPI